MRNLKISVQLPTLLSLFLFLLIGMGRMMAQEALIEPDVWLPEVGYDPCAEPSGFSYLPLEGGETLCDQFPNYTPSPGCTIANGTTTNYGANTLVENKDFLVNGTWTIIVGTLQDFETVLVYKNCNFKMASGAQIIVKCNNNKDMAFEGCNLFSCDQMWRGISVEHHFTVLGLNTPTFRFDLCHIEDAASALWFRNPSLAVSFEITSNTFNNNYIGLTAFKDFANGAPQWMALGMRDNQIGTNQNLRPFYSIKVPPLWPLAYAGVNIKKLSTFIGGTSTTNFFFRMANGIVCENSVLTSVHNEFNTLWTNGTMSLASHLTVVNQNTFLGNQVLPSGQAAPIMENGIFAISSDLDVRSNTFVHRLRHGIWSEQNQNAQVINISSNTFSGSVGQNWGLNLPCGICIERSAAAPSAGIPAHNDIDGNTFDIVCKNYVAILVKGVNTATDKLLVRERNDIDITNIAPSGMVGVAVRTGNSENTEITGNLIDLVGKFQSGNFGIELFTYNSVNFKVKGNDIDGGIDPNPDPLLTHPYSAQCCIHNDNADDANSDICDNITNNSQRGLHFVNGMAEVRENKINDHEFGVDIQPYPILPMLGQQDGRGNQWLGSYITNAALRRGTIDPNTGMNLPNSGKFPQLCRFWAFEAPQPSIYLPASSLLDPNPGLQSDPNLKWFRYDPSTLEDYCSEMAAAPPGVNAFEMKIAGGLLSDLPAAKIWDAKRNLYRKILENPSLLQGNTVLQSFHTAQQNSSVASFAQTDAYIRNATRYAQTEQQSRDALTLSIQQNIAQADAVLASINYDVSLATPAQMESLADFGEQISTDYGSRSAIDQSRQQQVAALLGNAQASNNALSPANAQQQARKDLNNLLIKALRQTPTAETDYQAALNIATQSSDVVGGAAHEAALLLKICDQSAFVSQHEHDGTEERKNAHPSVRTSGQKSVMQVSPNPSDAGFQVQLAAPVNGLLRIIDASGVTLQRIEVGMEQTSVSVNSTKFAPGVYFLILQSADGQTLETARVVIL